jgi:hypothetical protein
MRIGRVRGMKNNVGTTRGLANNPVILSMGADPDPIDSLFDLGSQCSVMVADAHKPKIIYLFEV